MELKESLKEKLPKNLKESPEFNVLISLISSEDIESAAELDAYLKKEAEKTRKWLDENKTRGTISGERRKKVRWLEFLETVKKEVTRYL